MGEANKRALVNALRVNGHADLAEQAEKGAFSDFASEYASPMMILVKKLLERGDEDLARRARRGEFDHDT